MSLMIAVTLPARIDSLPRGLALVVECATAVGFPPQRVMEIELAVEEALANICLYAYPNGSGEVEVRCTQDETRHFSIGSSILVSPSICFPGQLQTLQWTWPSVR